MNKAFELATVMELHNYGRQLLIQKKINEAITVFEKNYKKNNGAWPTNVGMMRALSAKGEYAKALEYGQAALFQAPDTINKKSLEENVKLLQEGKAVR